MNNLPQYLMDQQTRKVASLNVSETKGGFQGSICLEMTPQEIQGVFQKFEEVIEGQMFSLLDEVEEEIEKLSLQVVFENEDVFPVADLQVFPSRNVVSFQVQQCISTS